MLPGRALRKFGGLHPATRATLSPDMVSAARSILRFLVSALVVLLALVTLGALFPGLPVLGEMGAALVDSLGPWLAILPLIGGIIIFRRPHRVGGKRASILLALAAFASIGTTFMLGRQVAAAHANNIAIDPLPTLLPHPQRDDSLHPVGILYSSYAGKPLPLDIYPLPTNHVGTAPVLVYIHGGGWNTQTLKQRQADYRWFRERGYLIISLEYSLSSETQHNWNVVQPELGCALAWVGANAGRFGGDVSRLALWGESAGGNLVLNLSYMANQAMLKPSCPGEVPRVGATIALYPVVDPAHMYRSTDPVLAVFDRMMTVDYTGGTPAQFPARYVEIAAATYISAAAPPTLLIVPEADHVVDPQSIYAFAAKAQAAGVAVSTIRMPYAEHAFDMASGSIGNQLVRRSMLRFLAQHGVKP